MGAEERAKRLTDIAKIVEEKAKDIDRCHMEGSYETDKPWEEMVFWLWKARECVDSLLVAPGGQNIGMTKPQPCTKFRNAGMVEWIAKLSEETNEAIQRELQERYPKTLYINPIAQFKALAGMEYDTIMGYCLELLDKCGAVTMTGDYRASKGCMIELAYAREYHIPVFFYDADKHEYVEEEA